MMKIKAIIFDVDGTIADTEEAHRLSFNQAFVDNKLNWFWDVPLYDKLLKITGGKERIKYYITNYLPDFQKPHDYEETVKNLHKVKTIHYTTMLKKGLIPFRTNIKKIIIDAKKANIRLAIATTTSPENVTALLQQEFGNNYTKFFEIIGCGDIVQKKKPAPDIYIWVLNQMNLDPSDCIALEDSENGLKSALAAGIKTFITTNQYTHHQNFTGAVAVYKDLSQLKVFYRAAKLEININ